MMANTVQLSDRQAAATSTMSIAGPNGGAGFDCNPLGQGDVGG